MALQFREALRNALLDLFETQIGTTPILELRTGGAPANCAAASTGTLVASMTLPSDFMAAASAGSKAKSGTWSDPSANSTNTIAHFRIFDSGGTNCFIQGTVTVTGGGGDMTLNAVAVTTGQTINITTFTLSAPGA
jgi:hypothetical protein